MGGVRRTGADMQFFVNDIMHFPEHFKKKSSQKIFLTNTCKIMTKTHFFGPIPVK